METQVRAALDSGWRSARTGRRTGSSHGSFTNNRGLGVRCAHPAASRLGIFVSARSLAAVLAGRRDQRPCCLMTRRECARALAAQRRSSSSQQAVQHSRRRWLRRRVMVVVVVAGRYMYPRHATCIYPRTPCTYSRQASKRGNQ